MNPVDGRPKEVPRSLVLWGRAGYVARGVLYLIVGALATLATLGRSGGETTDSKGALLRMFDQPLGTALLWTVAAGLAGYAVWRAADAILDPEGKGREPKKLAVRAWHLCSAITHAALAVFAVRLAIGDAPSRDGDLPQRATGSVFQLPAGRWLVLAGGLVVVVVGLVHLVRGARGHYEKRLERRPTRWVCWLGRFGHMARGVVIGTIGVFLGIAAIRFHSAEARGLEGALDALREQPYGKWLLLAVALGLVAFGVWSLVEARLRFMPASPQRGHAPRALAPAR
jgi:hypothetical protein